MNFFDLFIRSPIDRKAKIVTSQKRCAECVCDAQTICKTQATAEDSSGVGEQPPQAKRKPMTDAEIWEFWVNRPEVADGEDDSMEAQFVAACRRAIEARHGIGKQEPTDWSAA